MLQWMVLHPNTSTYAKLLLKSVGCQDKKEDVKLGVGRGEVLKLKGVGGGYLQLFCIYVKISQRTH